MCRFMILLSLAAVSMAQDAFFEKYAFIKSMANCLGEEPYYGYLTKVAQAEKYCQQVPVSILHKPRLDLPIYPQLGYPIDVGGQIVYIPVPSYNGYRYTVPLPHTHPELLNRKTREAVTEETVTEAVVTEEEEEQQQPEPVFDRKYIQEAVTKIMASLSNYTCVLKEMGTIDEHLTIQMDNAISEYFKIPLDDDLRQDLINGLYYCQDMVNCLPLERLKSPLPLNVQRLLIAMKCERKSRTNVCFKHDLRKNIDSFDLSLFSKDESEESKLNKLAAILIGEDSLNELELI